MVSVENMWIRLCGSLWESCGKVLHNLQNGEFYTKKWAKVEVFHDKVEKFCYTICTWFNRGKIGFCTVSTGPTITTINLYRKG